MKRLLIGILGFFLVLLVVIAAMFAFLPWKEYAAPVIAGQMRARGLPVASFTLETIGMDGVTLAPLVLSTEPPLTLPRVTLGWNISGLRSPQLDTLTLTGLRYEIAPHATSKESDPLSVPVDPALFAQIPLKQVKIEDATLAMQSEGVTFDVPFSGHVTFNPPRLVLHSTEAVFSAGEETLTAEDIRLTLTLNAQKQRWEGDVAAKSLTRQGEEALLPPLSPKAALKVAQDTLSADITADPYQAKLRHHFKDSRTEVSNLSLPVAGGTVEAAPFSYVSGKPVKTTFTLRGVNLETALALLLKDAGVAATGTLDGDIPVSYSDGLFSLGSGTLRARDEGTLALTGDNVAALSGAGGQAGNVALLLGDFHFNLLALEFEPAPEEEVVVRLRLEGNNPNVYDGKRVHLNVTLQGDVMKSLRSSLELLGTPQEWIEKEMRDKR